MGAGKVGWKGKGKGNVLLSGTAASRDVTSNTATSARAGSFAVGEYERVQGSGKWRVLPVERGEWRGLELLMWAREHDCPCNWRVCSCTCRGGRALRSGVGAKDGRPRMAPRMGTPNITTVHDRVRV